MRIFLSVEMDIGCSRPRPLVGIHLYGDFIPMHCVSDDMTLHFISTVACHYRDFERFGAKLRDWADRRAEAGCYSWVALASNDSKTL